MTAEHSGYRRLMQLTRPGRGVGIVGLFVLAIVVALVVMALIAYT